MFRPPHLSAALVACVSSFALCPLATTQQPEPLALQLVASGLDLPVYATAPAGDPDRVFVLELYAGLIRIVRDGQPLPTPFLDLSDKILGLGERGLLSMVFHPDYANNGEFFVFYNNIFGATTLARYHVDPSNPDQSQPNGQVLLTLPQHYPEHNGGMMQFGPDGLFYLSTGDGGGPLDPDNQAQDLSSLLGKILRLDVDRGSGYAIPPDNPFVDVPGARPEIFCYGLRNPWRFAVDELTGSLLIADVGADSIEEIDLVPAGTGGQNFGWRCKEGTLCTGLPGCACPAPGFVDPIFQYPHGPGCAAIGGFVYRGPALPGHHGEYFFADWCTGNVVSLDWNAAQGVTLTDHSDELIPPDAPTLMGISSFGKDGQGELLVLSVSGSIYRVIPFADCDGDGIQDAEEIATGTSFDANQDGTPDECQLLLQGSDLVAGEPAWLWFVGAQPGQPLLFFASASGLGAGPCLFQGAVCLGIAPFSMGGADPDVLLLAALPADEQGSALLRLDLPPDLVGLTALAFQTVVAAGSESLISNPLLLPVIP